MSQPAELAGRAGAGHMEGLGVVHTRAHRPRTFDKRAPVSLSTIGDLVDFFATEVGVLHKIKTQRGVALAQAPWVHTA